MTARLVRHAFKDRSDWLLVKTSVPLGTIYEIIGFESNVEIYNLETKERKITNCYYVKGNGTEGYMPVDVLDID